MTTHTTIEAARSAAKDLALRNIIEIEHATAGHCYIVTKCPMQILATALRAKPMAEIKRLVADHEVLTPAEQKAEREQFLRDHSECERCGAKVDGNTAYSQKERFAGNVVTVYYCETCRGLLQAIGAGEYTAMQERAATRYSREPETKGDF